MEFVSDNFGIRKLFTGKVFKWITQIQDHIFDVLSPFDMRELWLDFSGGFALSEFKDSAVRVIHDDRRKLRAAKLFIATEGVFIDADCTGPWVLSHSEFLLEASVERFKNVTCTDAISFLNAREVDEVLACPKDLAFEAFGSPRAFFDSRNVFSERFLTGLAPKASFLDLEKYDLVANGSILHRAEPSIID